MLIGIHGLRYVGKDTVADMLVGYMPYLRTVALADHLKTTCSVFYNVPLVNFHDQSLKEEVLPRWGMSPRQMMMKMADVLRESHGTHVFVDIIEEYYNSPGIQQSGLIVTDVREPHEREFIDRNNGLLVHVLRQTGKGQIDHGSEAGLPIRVQDYVIRNNSSLYGLSLSVEALAQHVRRHFNLFDKAIKS